MAIAAADPEVGCMIHRGTDFYVYDKEKLGGWAGMDEWGLAQHLVDPGFKVIKMGRAMPTRQYLDAFQAINEAGLEKIASYPWEVKD